MDKPLSGHDIQEIFHGKCKIVLYKELTNYRSIDALLAPHGRVCILYVWALNPSPFGHWICVFKNVNNNIEVFDPFGTWIDATLDTFDTRFRKENNEYYKQLSHLLYHSNYEVEYNDKQLQNKKSNTCGKWCAYRMLRNDLTIEEFNDMFSNDTKKNDQIILKLFSR